MKKVYLIFASAIAAITFASCNVEPIENGETTGTTHSVSFVSDQLQTKTEMMIDEGKSYFWWDSADCDNFTIYENDELADDYDAEAKDGIMSIYAQFAGDRPVSPKYNAYLNQGVSALQTCDYVTYDRSADILVAEAGTTMDEDEFLTFTFKRVVAISQMTIKGMTAGETVSSVVLSSDKAITGDFALEFDENNNANETWSNDGTSLTITPRNLTVAEDGTAIVNFITRPVENAQLTITVTTTANTYTKEFASPITFSSAKVKTFGVTVSKSVSAKTYTKITSLDDIDDNGEYILAGENDDKTYILPCNPTVTSGKIAGVEVSVLDNTISTNENYGWKIVKIGSYYKITDGEQNLYHSNGGSSGTNLTYGTSTSSLWNITASNNEFSFAGVKVNDDESTVGSRGMLMNGTQFGGYSLSNAGSSGYSTIKIYKYVSSTPAPKIVSITVSGTPTTMEYTEGDSFDPAGLVVTGTYEDGSTATISSGITWTFDPETLTAETTSVSVTAAVGEISSNVYTVAGINVSAAPVTIDLNNAFYKIETGNNEVEQSQTTEEGITIVSGCLSSASSKTYYDSQHIRYYVDSYLKISIDGTISKIVFIEPTSSKKWDATDTEGISVNTGTYANSSKTWTGSSDEVVFNFSKQCRIGSIEITYTIDTTPKYTVTCSNVDGGTISASPSKAIAGTEITLTATPNIGYEFNNDWVVKGADNSTISVTNGKFLLPEQNVTVLGTFKSIYAGSGTEEDPYTIDDIYNYIDELGGKTSEKEVCVAGTIYQIDSYNATYHSITYWIGSEDKPFEVYGGLNNPSKIPFSSKDDLLVGDKVVVKGKVKKFNATYEFEQNNTIVSRVTGPYLRAIADKTTDISADGETVTITVDTNIESWNASSDNTSFTVKNKTANSVDVEVSENTSTTDDREAKITVSATGVKDVVITLTQAKAVGGGSDDSKVLTFDMSKNPGGWPTDNSTTLTDYTYTLDGTSYTFGLKNVKCNSGYLMLTSTAVLGLPAIDGKKLTKVVAKNSSGCSTSTKVGVSSSSSSASYISGGAIQTWSTTSSSYTYTLSGTEAGKVYYLYVTNKNAQIVELTLTYE